MSHQKAAPFFWGRLSENPLRAFFLSCHPERERRICKHQVGVFRCFTAFSMTKGVFFSGSRKSGGGRFSFLHILLTFHGEFTYEHHQSISKVILHRVFKGRIGYVWIWPIHQVRLLVVCETKKVLHSILKCLWAVFVQGVGDKTGKYHGSTDWQWTACPPKMERRDMSVANALVAHTLCRNLLNRESYFYQFLCFQIFFLFFFSVM